MLDYAKALDELVAWGQDIAKFEQHLRNQKYFWYDSNEWNSRHDMLLMIELFQKHLKNLHVEATVCRQRKKTTPYFEKLYRRAVEYRDVVESNRVMYSLMFA